MARLVMGKFSRARAVWIPRMRRLEPHVRLANPFPPASEVGHLLRPNPVDIPYRRWSLFELMDPDLWCEPQLHPPW